MTSLDAKRITNQFLINFSFFGMFNIFLYIYFTCVILLMSRTVNYFINKLSLSQPTVLSLPVNHIICKQPVLFSFSLSEKHARIGVYVKWDFLLTALKFCTIESIFLLELYIPKVGCISNTKIIKLEGVQYLMRKWNIDICAYKGRLYRLPV